MLGDISANLENKDEFHQASVHRNKLLHRAVDVITGLQTDTDNLLVAADLHKDAEVDLLGSTPQTQFKITIGKSSPFKSSKPHAKEPSYEQAAFDAAQHRNALLQRAYSVISNLQTDVDGLVEEVSVSSSTLPATPPPIGHAKYLPIAPSDLNTDGSNGDIMRTAAATSAAAARLRSRAENAQRQAQEAEQAQLQAAAEEAKANKLADQAEQRSVTEQGSGNLAAAVAASSAAAKLRRGAADAQDKARQLKARAELKFREAQDSRHLAQQAQHKAQALEAAGLSQGTIMSSPAASSPLPYQSPALLKGLHGNPTFPNPTQSNSAYPILSNIASRQASGTHTPTRASSVLATPSSRTPVGAHSLGQLYSALPSRPSSPVMLDQPSLGANSGAGTRRAVSDTLTDAETAKLFQQAVESQTQEAKQAAQQWQDTQAAVATANKQAQEAAAAVAAKHKAANAAKAEAERLERQAAEFKQAGKRDAAKKTQQQAHKMQQAVAVAEQAVEAAEQHEWAAAETAQAAAAASFAAEAQASKLAGTVKEMQEASEAGVLAARWRLKASEATKTAIGLQELAQQHSAQAATAGAKAAAAEEQAQQFEAQGKFADAAAAALHADRWHKAAFDGAKQVAKLQAEAKAATAQSDSATAAAMEAKGLAKRLEALAIQKQQHAAVHAVPGQPGHVQNSDAQRAQQAQRAVPPAPQGPVKPSGLMKPSLLAHSPSRLSRMTMQDDNALEESSKGSGLQFRSREDSQGAMDARSTVSRIVSPQTTGFSNSGSKRQSHDNSEGVHQLHPSNPSHSGATLTELQQRTSDHERSRGVELHQQDRLRSQGSIKRSASEQSEQAPASIVARRITLQQEQSAASSDAYDGLALRPQLSVLTPEQQRGRESGSYSAQHATSRQASDLSAAVHAESQDLNKQVWQQAEGDDIAAAVAQYTGSKHGDFPTDGLDHQGFKMVPGQHAQHACEELPHDTARPRLALQHGDNFKKSESFHHREHEDSDRHAAELSYVEQQARMDAEFEDAMLADQSSHQDLAEHGSTAKQYATPQEQMEAELEAAMAADAAAGSEGFTQGGDADRPLQEGQWGSPESTSTSGRQTGKPVYANAQEQMEAELNAALAADAAAAPDDSSQATATGLAAENNALLRLSLPANGLDADGDLPVLELRIDQGKDDQKKSELEGLVQKWQGTCKKARRHAEACYAEAQAKASEAEEAAAQAAAAQAEAEDLAGVGRHNEAEAAAAAAQRWVRRAAQATQDGQLARAEGDSKTTEAGEAAAQALQVQQQLEGQVWAAASDLQQTAPVPTISSPRASPRLLGRTATPARSNLLQLLTGDTNELQWQQGQESGAVQVEGSRRSEPQMESGKMREARKSRRKASNSAEHSPTGRSEVPNVQTHSPVFRALAVPEWLNSPRSTSAATWQTSERARTGSRTVTAEASFDSPRRRSTRSLGNIHSGTVSSDPSSETLTDVRQDRQSVPRYSQDSQGQLEAAHAPSGNNGHQAGEGALRAVSAAAQWAKRNAKALKLARRAKEAAAASEQEAAAAAEEAERATLEAEQREAANMQDDETAALRQAAAKWTKRAGKASRAAARARAEAEAQEAEAAQAAQLAQLSSAESDSPAPAATEAAAASAVPSGAHLQPSMLLAADNELSQGTSVPYLAGNADSGLDSSLLEHHTARYADQAAGAAMAGPLAGDQGMLSLQPQHNALLWGTAMPQPDAAQTMNAYGTAAQQSATMTADGGNASMLQLMGPASNLQPDVQASGLYSPAVGNYPSVQSGLQQSLADVGGATAHHVQNQPLGQQNDAHSLQQLGSPGRQQQQQLTSLPVTLPAQSKTQQQRQQQPLQLVGVDGDQRGAPAISTKTKEDDISIAAYKQWSNNYEAQLGSAAAEQPGSAEVAPQPNSESAIVTWDAFKTLARPGDRLRLVGDALPVPDNALPASEAAMHPVANTLTGAQQSHQHGNISPDVALSSLQGIVMPAGSSMPLVTDAEAAKSVVGMPAGSSMPLLTDGDVGKWVVGMPAGTSSLSGNHAYVKQGQFSAPLGDMRDVGEDHHAPAMNSGDQAGVDFGADDTDGLTAASSQADRLMMLAQARDEEAEMSSERAHSLQQLAAGSAVLSEASQLSAAAQQCIARAEQAAQMALLARAEAARLSGTALPLQTALHTASAPTADSSDHAAVSPAALSVNDPASATMTRQLTTEVSTSQPAVCSSDHATATDLGAPCDPEIAADIVDMLSMQLPNLGLSANVFLPSSPQQKSAAQLVQSLSADMRAAMQQLLASAPSASDSDMHGGPRAAAVYPNVRGSDASSPRDMQQQHLSTEASQVKHQSHAFVGSGLLDFHANGAELQSHDLPEQAAQSLPYLAQPDVGKIPSSSTPQQQQQQSIPGRIHAKHAVPWSSFRLPKQASRVESDEEVMRGFSGMELHLIHQLEGLERSVQRVEEQVSSNKQTRRLLKAVSTPAQDDASARKGPLYLDGLPMEYWIVPPRTPLTAVTPPVLGSKHLFRSGMSVRLAPNHERGIASTLRHSTGDSRRHDGHYSTMLKTRLPMSAYATPVAICKANSTQAQTKENQPVAGK